MLLIWRKAFIYSITCPTPLPTLSFLEQADVLISDIWTNTLLLSQKWVDILIRLYWEHVTIWIWVVLEMLLFIRFCFGSVLFLLVFVLENCFTFCLNLNISQHPEYSFLVFSSFLKQFFIPSFPIIQKVQFSKFILTFPNIQKHLLPQHFSTSRVWIF